MTTAHKPTFHPAIGTANQGGYRYFVRRAQFSSRDLPGQLDLKQRKKGQNTTEEIAARDLKAELEAKEAAHFAQVELDRQRQGLLPEPDRDATGDKDKATLAIAFKADQAALDEFDDSDDSSSGSDNDSDDDSDLDSEDEEKALMAELAAIKREKEEQRRKEELQREQERAAREEQAIKDGNPLIAKGDSADAAPKTGSFALKRSWCEDTVFKNQAPEPKRQKRFINDTIRSDFHRKFMARYIK